MSSQDRPLNVRTAGADDVDAVVATLTTAFFRDPVWGPAFPDPGRRAAQAGALWRLLATSALRYPWLLVTGNVEAAAVWIPPGGEELTEAEADGFAGFLREITDEATAAGILAVLEPMEAARPKEPHFYLSLLGTHDDHRGQGLGVALLRESLVRIDELRMPAYLESSNPAANDKRYAALGFVPNGELVMPDGHVVTTMWRPARG
ncbi:GNAT family N-acetyltransferase [Streptacidiphilus pinicola]|uniref:GNAT family N-acetyltransferase n=1 Tax=Streptacidiphilus pinicola TaxID=2219663 RepID=A0A2X0J0Y1_9ACTN|nr:GNAT family N-acetyltransferase [Streptacidiphilus pinicola]RAG83856.1 GNAT family N-acetyltransferase [Streptacidiphilus pinicola]